MPTLEDITDATKFLAQLDAESFEAYLQENDFPPGNELVLWTVSQFGDSKSGSFFISSFMVGYTVRKREEDAE